MSQPLVDRYRRLLSCYPQPYRRERGDEILDTLAQLARPGQRYPTPREALGLIVGGLRVRAGADQRGTTATAWVDGLHLTVLLLLASAGASMLGESVRVVRQLVLIAHPSRVSDLGYPVTTVLLCGALAASAAARRRWALGLMVAAMATEVWALSWLWLWLPWQSMFEVSNGWLWQPPIAAAVTLLLARRPVRAARRPGRWWVALPLGLLLLPTQLIALFNEDSWEWKVSEQQRWVELAVLVACTAWAVIDARVALAAGSLIVATVLPGFVVLATASYPVVLRHAVFWFGVYSVAAAVPLTFGGWQAARQARL